MILDPETVCSLIYKLRRLHGSELAEPDGADASNDVDDGMDDVLVEGRDSGNRAEIEGLLEGLESEQLDDLVAFILLGRDPDEYANIEDAKAGVEDFSTPVLDYLADNPASVEFLSEGLERAGYICDPFDGGVSLTPKGGGARRRNRRA